MKNQGARLVAVVAVSTLGCTLLLHLLHSPLFPPITFSLGKQWNPLNEVLEHLSLLVEGEDEKQLRSTGFSCQTDDHAHVCLSSTQVRIQARDNQELTIYQPDVKGPPSMTTVKPYARQEDDFAMRRVSPVNIFYGTVPHVPRCDIFHNVSAVVFSSGGFLWNLFHGFSETFVPLFLTTHHFNKQVQFVISDFEPFLVNKFKSMLAHLSDYEPIALQDNKVHCFPGAVVGLKFHSNLGINPTEIPKGNDMNQFRKYLRESYSLNTSSVSQLQTNKAKPVLLLISRRNTRVFLNEDEMVAVMTSLGYDVIVADSKVTEDLDKFSKVVNRCSVIVGAHGAGMTNLVFLPAGAVVVQVVSLGLDWASDAYFGEGVSSNMGLKYVLYKIDPKESSLADVYGLDHPVITDPQSETSKGYEAYSSTYLNGQNLKINLRRFRKMLVKVKEFLDVSRTTD